jgi:hypothetical protein
VSTEPSRITDHYAGVLHIFVAFDWGEEINLDKARGLGPAELHSLPRKSRTPPSIAYRSAPLRLKLAPVALSVPVLGAVQAQADVMLFDFGAVSLMLEIPFHLGAPELTQLAGALSDPSRFLQAARDALAPIYHRLEPAIENPAWLELNEDYFVFQLFPDSTPAPAHLLAQYPGWLAGLVRLESDPLSESEIAEALRLRLSYSPNDLIITDWPAAVVVDRDCDEILETMALANLQLLEFRHIDDRLDDQLKATHALIDQLIPSRLPIFRSHARAIRSLGALRVEVNEMFERAHGALTLVGDPFVGRAYYHIAARFHLDQWGQDIRRSIDVLQGLYEAVADQASHYRTEALEIIVVLLIFGEILLALFRH